MTTGKDHYFHLGKGSIFFLFVVCLLILFPGCRKDLELCPDNSPANDLTSAPYGFPEIPFPEDNAFTQARWELGKKLFYDPILSIDSSISCGSCHKIEYGFADPVAFSPGVEGRPGTRNASSLTNVAYQPWYLREGSLTTLEMQVAVPIQEHNEFAHNIVDIAAQLNAISEYVEMSQAAYERDPDPFVITRAISTFERTLISGNSPYDRWEYQNCDQALTDEQQRGRELFFSERTQCFQCHGGFNFTTYDFENNGLYAEYADIGRMRQTSDSADLALFKIPTLRNIEVTGPYMHDGSLATLEAVVEHYNSGGAGHIHQSDFVQPLGLNDTEKASLVAFLKALTDEEFLTNPFFSE